MEDGKGVSMKRSFYVGDRRFAVKLEEIEKGRELIVTVDGKRHHVYLGKDTTSANLLQFVVDNKPRRISVLRRMGIDRIQVSVNGSIFSVSESPMRPPLGSRLPTLLPSKGLTRRVGREVGILSAPAPGRIILIKVKEGDVVEEGDALLILESMKMETMLRAHTSGIVGEVKVREGDSVSTGDVLLSLKTAGDSINRER